MIASAPLAPERVKVLAHLNGSFMAKTREDTRGNKPKVVIANTIKGKGICFLENSSCSHVLSVKSDEIEKYIEQLK